MLVFVDYEHADGHGSELGERLLAARTRITYRLEDLAGMHCHLVRYDRIDHGLLDHLGARAIFVSGNSKSPEDYAPADLESIHATIRRSELPIFGFCGGLQLIAQALGCDIVPLTPDVDDPMIITTDDGRPVELGHHPVELTADGVDHPLLHGLGDRPVFRHAHGLHVPALPDGFRTLASTRATPIQLAVDDRRHIVGSQFHPEYWTDEHPAGRTLIANFLRWSGAVDPVD